MLYKNRTASEEERVNDLLSRMTVDEKLAQLYMHQDPLEISKMIEEGTYPEAGISATNASQRPPVEVLNRIQKYQIENTRLGIPILVTGESIHGVMYP
ncbi:MAG: beta-glucosidase, partial [Clostridiales bacterium]|nr:beta-glucosidase [Clostridiales bacterium]